MVTTRSSHANQEPKDNPLRNDLLAAIALHLEVLDILKENVSALESQFSHSNRRRGRHRNWAYDSKDDSESSRRGQRPPHAKIEFPKFSGGDPRGWVLKVEKYFRYYDIPEDDKVDIASVYLEGDALDLFSWMNAECTLLYWDDLVKALQEHYGPPEYQNPNEHLCSIKQTGSVHEYRLEFARQTARVEGWPEHCLLRVFLNGLKEELRSDVRIHKPKTVYRAASLALEFEKKLISTKEPKPSSLYGPIRSNPLYHQAYSNHDQKGNTVTSSGSIHTLPSTVHSYSSTLPSSVTYSATTTESVRQHRREKGLCFRCGEQFRPGHRCVGKFSLMEIDEAGNPMPETSEPVDEPD